MTPTSDVAPVTVAAILRSLVRQLAAATYAYLLFLLLAQFVAVDGWATFVLQGTCAAFGGWLLARVTEGPWWSWAFMAPFAGAIDLSLSVAVLATAAPELSVVELAVATVRGSLAISAVALLGSIAGLRRRKPPTARESSIAGAANASVEAATKAPADTATNASVEGGTNAPGAGKQADPAPPPPGDPAP